MLPCSFARRLLRLVATFSLGNAAWLALAQTPPPADPARPPGVAPLRTWDITGNVRTAVGYRDNLLLSAVRSTSSAFAQTEAEIFLWHLPTERFEALAFANATYTRFVESKDVPHETQTFAHAEARGFAPHDLQATVTLEGYQLDQVFDLSTTGDKLPPARFVVTGALASVALRWDARPDTWLEFKPTAQRDHYRDGTDHNTQRIARATVGRKFFADRLEVALSAQTLRRTYDIRPQYSVAGRALARTRLTFEQREGEARVAVTWDRAQRWSTVTAAILSTNDDNGSGYFDYQHRALRQEISWTNASWKVRLTARAARYDYDVQTEGIGINPPHRLKEEVRTRARVERTWTKHTLLYVEAVWERSRSNDPLANYRVKSAGAGVDWIL